VSGLDGSEYLDGKEIGGLEMSELVKKNVFVGSEWVD
jgi:hypothetical protein